MCDPVICAAHHKNVLPLDGTCFCLLFVVHSIEAEVGTITLYIGANGITIGHCITV